MSKISFKASKGEDKECLWMEQLLSMSPGPILRVRIDGKVLYANEASAFLMKFWDIREGEIIPPEIGKLVEKAIMQQRSYKLEVKAKPRDYFLTLSPAGEEYVHIYGLDPNCREESGQESYRLKKQHKKSSGSGKHFLSYDFCQSSSSTEGYTSPIISSTSAVFSGTDNSLERVEEPERALRMQKML